MRLACAQTITPATNSVYSLSPFLAQNVITHLFFCMCTKKDVVWKQLLGLVGSVKLFHLLVCFFHCQSGPQQSYVVMIFTLVCFRIPTPSHMKPLSPVVALLSQWRSTNLWVLTLPPQLSTLQLSFCSTTEVKWKPLFFLVHILLELLYGDGDAVMKWKKLQTSQNRDIS